MTTLWLTFLILLGVSFLLIIGVIMYFIIQFFRYNKIVIMEDLGNKTTTPRIYKACRTYDKRTQIFQWKLRGEWNNLYKRIPVPPKEAITRTEKGKAVVKAWRTQEGEIIYQMNDIKIGNMPNDIFKDIPKEIREQTDSVKRMEALEKWKTKIKKDWIEKHGIAIRPLTTNQRITHFHYMKDAYDRHKRSWLEMLPQILVAGLFVLLLVQSIILMVFWKDLTEPAIAVQTQKTAQAEAYARTVETSERLMQYIEKQEGNSEIPH